MIKKIHSHLRQHSQLHILGGFYAMMGLLVVTALMIAEFDVPKNAAHTSVATAGSNILTTTTCVPTSNVTIETTSGLHEVVYPTNPPTLNGTTTFSATFDTTGLGLTSAQLLSTALPTCVEVLVQNGTAGGTNYYAWLYQVSTASTATLYTINIPFDTTILANNTINGYAFDIHLYVPRTTVTPIHYSGYLDSANSGTFYVSNSTSGSPYQITQPVSAVTTNAAFPVVASAPAGASVPSLLRANATPAAPTTPTSIWSFVSSGTLYPASTNYGFSVPMSSPGTYVYRVCPNTYNETQPVPAPTCSGPLSVTFTTTGGGTCSSNWNCGSWSACGTNGAGQTRTCTDTNQCATSTNPPVTWQSCGYYQMTSPSAPAGSLFTTPTSSSFQINVTSPSGLQPPALYAIRTVQNSIDLTWNYIWPWVQEPEPGIVVSGNYQFTVPPKSIGTYQYRACPSGLTAGLSTTNPNNYCSNPPLTASFVAPSTTTNTNTAPAAASSTSPRPTITSPITGAALNELSVITGVAEPGLRVHVDLFRLVNPTTTTLQRSDEVTAAATGGFSSGVSPLQPGDYRIEAKTLKNGTWSTVVQQSFTILPVTLTLTSRSASPLSGIVQYDVHANRSDISRVSFYRSNSSAVAPEVYLGSSSAPVQGGSPTNWSFSFNTKEQPNGVYGFRVLAEVAGTTVSSGTLTLAIKNDTTTTTGIITTNTNTTSVTPTPPTNTNSSVVPPVVPPPVSTNLTTAAAATTVVVPATTKNLDQQPAADPRKSGEAKPDTYVVQAVTTIESNTNIPSGLKLTGVGPANSYVTVYIFSTPVIITTLTDGNGNWTYTLDRPLDNGSHEVYVTLTDDTGAVAQKSNPLAFFVAEARAVSPQDFQRFQDQQSKLNQSYTGYYLAMSGLLVGLSAVLFLYLRLRRHHQSFIASK